MNHDDINLLGAEILIVDDQPANLGILARALEGKGFQISIAQNGERAIEIAADTEPSLILLDVMMPGIDGFETCRRLKQLEVTQDIPVIFITAKGETDNIIKGFNVGGVDYIQKPFQVEEVLTRVETHVKLSQLTQLFLQSSIELAAANRELQEANQKLQQEIERREQAEQARQSAEAARQTTDERLKLISAREAKRWGIEGFIGRSRTIAKILTDVNRLQTTGTVSVLIQGESGTGKELIARAIHFGGPRAKRPFIAVNCSAVPKELAESEFFGHTKGAFTGANTDKKGYFELADGGTLFLDEIGDMPLELQAKLLRVLEDGVVTPIGERRDKKVDVRVLAATNIDLQTKIATATFRNDLYYRLAEFPVDVPPLRDRREDIPLLASHFMSLYAAEMGVEKPQLSSDASAALAEYPFPGNVRELKNIIVRALLESEGEPIKPEHLHLMTPPSPTQRIGGANETQTPDSARSDEEQRILAYIAVEGSINNAECRELLEVDFDHASYLLKKLHRNQLLVRKGQGRWSRYSLP
jgi:DNA-binding NtrC family response regulator